VECPVHIEIIKKTGMNIDYCLFRYLLLDNLNSEYGWKRIGCGSCSSHIRLHIFKTNKDANTDIVERMWSGFYLNKNTDRMFFQYGKDANNKIIDLYIIVSQVYNYIIHNSLKSDNNKNTFDHFASFFS
jgi:hypothetical protein